MIFYEIVVKYREFLDRKNIKEIREFISKNKVLSIVFVLFFLFILIDSALAATLDEQFGKANNLLKGSVLKVGVGGATIFGSIMAAVRGSVGLAASIMGIGVALSYFLGWVQSDTFIQ